MLYRGQSIPLEQAASAGEAIEGQNHGGCDAPGFAVG